MNANKTLAEVTKSRDSRFWEGFPLLLSNSLEKNLFNYDEVIENLDDYSDREYFRNLVIMSLALFFIRMINKDRFNIPSTPFSE